MSGARTALLAFALVSVACDYNNDGTLPPEPEAGLPPAPPPDAGPPPDLDSGRVASLDAMTFMDARLPLDASATTPNESFATAARLTEERPVQQDIRHSEQTNYFAFELQRPGFYELRTTKGEVGPDVVLSLYDDKRTLIAQNDQGARWPGDAVDARLVVQLTRPGGYFVAVEDRSTPTAFFQSATTAERSYALALRALARGTPGVVHGESASPSPVIFATDSASGYAHVTLVGALEVDTKHRFTLQSPSRQALVGHVLAGGTLGNGSRAYARRIQVRDADGQLLADHAGQLGRLPLAPPLAGGAYELTVEAPGQVEGDAFYAVDVALLPDPAYEQDDGNNGVRAGAETLALQGTDPRRGRLLAQVPPGDVDYFRFTGFRGEGAQVSCQGQAAGSGVRQLHLELRDGTDATLVTALTSAAHDLDIASFTLPAEGSYYLRLFRDNGASDSEALPWVRCTVEVGF